MIVIFCSVIPPQLVLYVLGEKVGVYGMWGGGHLRTHDTPQLHSPSSLGLTPNSVSLSRAVANGNDSRVYKGDRPPCGPSRVLHVRKVPLEVSEAELVSLGIPFGKVTNLLMLKGKNQVGAQLGTEP